ncbi:unnamed protein product [Eruca vesicaria subsp. sativa]|uniref:Uncharacterized protein n=1 Tax=Eruca vesicaria subsp. sativa TaxID=29727 RepID=A0ABC8M2Q7_ERUVS|nr:unnamed protein product [Eruca vesicaria subsp. sativa]
MAEYNMLSEVTYYPKIRSWRFRVQLHMIYPYAITNHGSYYNYILADEDPTSSPFRLNASRCTQVRIIEPLNSRLFLDFKSIHEIPRMHWRDLRYPIDTMGVVFNTKAYLDAPSRPRMEFYITENIDHQIKCVVTGDLAYAFQDGLDYLIVALKMWRIWKFMCK